MLSSLRVLNSSSRANIITRITKPLLLIRHFTQTASMTFWGDGREPRLLEHLKSLPASERNSPSSILAAIDAYSDKDEKHFLMNVGPDKGKIITDLMKTEKPKVMAELGGYVGYSAILFGEELKKLHPDGGVKYFSLEINEEFAGVAREVIDMAGLNDVVTIVLGPGSESLTKLAEEHGVDKVDILLVDHFEKFFLSDLKTAESVGLIKPGSTVIADNVIIPGAPDYLKYVRLSADEKKAKHPPNDGKKQPHYETKLVKQSIRVGGQEYDDGMEISKCAGYVE